jgi:sporulation protein YlmC with PRC-barrel domain
MKTLQLINQVKGYVIEAIDGNVGKVDEFYFDDRLWKIRYGVISLGYGRKILLSPVEMNKFDPANRVILASVTREQVRNSPDIDSELPVDRQHEIRLHEYYQWPFFLLGDGLMSFAMPGEGLIDGPKAPENQSEKQYDPHLRSSNYLTNMMVCGSDGTHIGKVHDFALDTKRWTIPFVVVKLQGKKMVLCNPASIAGVDDEEFKVVTNLTAEKIHALPIYDATHPTILCVDSFREIEETAAFNSI